MEKLGGIEGLYHIDSKKEDEDKKTIDNNWIMSRRNKK